MQSERPKLTVIEGGLTKLERELLHAIFGGPKDNVDAIVEKLNAKPKGKLSLVCNRLDR